MYGLYGLKHHTVEINGNVTLEDIHSMYYIQTYRHVNIELEFCEVLTEFAKIKLPEPPPAPRPPSAREQSDERSPSFDLEDVSERKISTAEAFTDLQS